MPQDMTAGSISASEADSGTKELLLVEMKFDSDTVRIWNGSGPIIHETNTFTGLGDLGQISQVVSSIETRPFSISIEVSGIIGDKDMIAKAESEDVIGRPISIWVGYLDANYVLISDPVLEFRGRMDTMSILLGTTISVAITAESRLTDWRRTNVKRFTNADQILDFPLDKGYEFATDALERTINWGGVPASGVGGGPISPTNSAGLIAARAALGL